MKEHLALKKSVGIWIRVSTDDQAKGDSPEHHEERARAYAKSRGWNVKRDAWNVIFAEAIGWNSGFAID